MVIKRRLILGCYEDIRWRDVTMADALRVQVVSHRAQVAEIGLEEPFGEVFLSWLSGGYLLGQRVLGIPEEQVDDMANRAQLLL